MFFFFLFDLFRILSHSASNKLFQYNISNWDNYSFLISLHLPLPLPQMFDLLEYELYE